MNSTNAPPLPGADSAVEHAARVSRYVRGVLAAEPDLAQRLDASSVVTRDAMRERLRVLTAQSNTLSRALRRLRKEVMVRLIARDLGGLADLAEVLTTITALAEIAIDAAADGAQSELAATYGVPRGDSTADPQRLHVVGMGKLGGGELNVSSDIDLVLVYPEDGETDGERATTNHEFFVRAARRLNALLSEVTEDGYVFRVDLRLRPYGESGPLVASFDMLENYLITQGREWERYAWIKGRTIAGDRGDELGALVRPFVFRRHLDYSAFASMRELHRQIRAEVERRDIADNIKLGPGGIREIEFIVQLFQLIRGGRDSALRRQATLAVLPLLADRRLLPADAVRELTDAYVFLRNLEHRLQYLDDLQTHVLPRSAEDRALIAQTMGARDYPAFAAELERHRANVTRHFHEIFATAKQDSDALAVLAHDTAAAVDEERIIEVIAALGYRDPGEVQRRLVRLRTSSKYRQMPAASQARLEKLIPRVVEAAAAHPSRDATLGRMLQFLEAISRREAYLGLLEQYPQALARIADLMGASPWAADYLTQHPILLDELLDARTLYEAPDWPALLASLGIELDAADGDVEKQMDTLRHFKHAQTMRLLAQDLAGTLPLETLSDHLSDLASNLLGEVIRLAWQHQKQRHRDRPAFAAIGYGKLGGKELGYASDLDLVFLYDDPAPEAAENYGRLVRRINQWLTTLTSGGLLYDTDLRLRPEGEGGLLVSPFESFRDYQLDHAWPWEHQALTRARFEAGDAEIGQKFEALRVEILRKARDLETLRASIVEMRQKMHAAHPNTSGLFDLKHDRGGIVDVEFIVQYLVLGYAHAHAALTGNIGNLALLKLAARLGLIDEALALAAHDAYRRFRQLQHALRLQGERYARIDPSAVAREAEAVRALWHAVLIK